MQYEVILPADKKACRFVTKAAAVCGSYAVLLAYAGRSFDGERCRLDKLQFIFTRSVVLNRGFIYSLSLSNPFYGFSYSLQIVFFG